MDKDLENQSKLQSIYQSIKDSLFNIMLELLKDKKIGKWYASFLLLVMFLQLIGVFFDPDNNFPWKDDFLLDVYKQVTDVVRIIPAIQRASAVTFYWIVYFLAIFVVVLVISLAIYTHYSIRIKKFYFMWPVHLLKLLLVFLYWALFNPFLEALISIFSCKDGNHTIVTSMECFNGIHILFAVLSIIFGILLFLICLLSAVFYNETQPVNDDALSSMDFSYEMLLLFVRTAIFIFTTFLYNSVGNWIIIILYLALSIFLCLHFFKYIPYFNSFVSIFHGSIILSFLWISLNALIMMILDIYGHLLIISIGIPIISACISTFRQKRVESILLMTPEKAKTDSEALLQIMTLQNLIKSIGENPSSEVTLIGLVNLHVIECTVNDCVCKSDSELYDVATGQFSQRNTGFHKDPIFLKHFTKRLYEDAIVRFSSSPMLNIAFSQYLFETIKNVHAALTELGNAAKRKPSIQQQFAIFRSRSLIENFIQQESSQAKDIYSQLTNVIEFERLLGECQKAIEKVCNVQIEFWSQLSNVMPDLNILNDLAKKIYDGSQEAEDAWKQLCAINSNYAKALTMYGTYLTEIKNNNQVGYELLEKARANTNKKSLDELVKSSDILFADDTVVLHVSGVKEQPGRIMKTNIGLVKTFGYSKNEVISHSVSILMPEIIGKRHNAFLEKFYKTGHNSMFNTEKYYFGLHRGQYCFYMKIVVKQMPSLSEGIQYVAMIRPIQGEYEYIITDEKGIINCISQGVGGMLNVSPSLFHGTNNNDGINIQVLAPDLIPVYSSAAGKKSLLEKYKQTGGHKLTFIVPKDFLSHVQSDSKKNYTRGDRKSSNVPPMKRTSSSKKMVMFKALNKDLNKHSGIASKNYTKSKILDCQEYKEYEVKQEVKCEIQDFVFGSVYRNFEQVKMRVFKITGINMKHGSGARSVDFSSEAGDGNDVKSRESARMKSEAKEDPENDKKNLLSLLKNEEAPKKSGDSSSGNGASPDNQRDAMLAPAAGQPPPREDTKTTERMPGAMMTTEGRLETQQQPFLKVAYNPNSQTGEVKKVVKAVVGGTEEKKEIPSVDESKKETEPQYNVKTEEAKKEEPEAPQTPPQSLGNLKSPAVLAADSRCADENTVQHQLESDEAISKSEQSSHGQLGSPPKEVKKKIEEEKKKGKIPLTHYSGTNLPDNQKLEISKDSKKPVIQSMMDDEKFKNAPDAKKEDKKEEKKGEEKKEGKEEENKDGGSVGDEEINSKDFEETKEEKVEVNPEQNPPANVKVPSMLDENVGLNKKNSLMKEASNAEKSQSSKVEGGSDESPHETPPGQVVAPIDLKDVEPPKSIQKKEETKKANNEKMINSGRPQRKAYHSKIVTSAQIERGELADMPEYRPSEEEIKLRKAFLAYERKKNKEKKKEEKETKKKEGEEKEGEGKEGEGETPEGQGEEEKKAQPEEEEENKRGGEIEDENQETQSSITSGSTGSTLRSYYSLRAAIDEKFIPSSIRNLKFAANIIFLLLLGLAIVYFVIQITLFDKINANIKNIHYSEMRRTHLINVNLQLIKMMLITTAEQQHIANPSLPDSQCIVPYSASVRNATFKTAKTNIGDAATNLKNAQTELSLKTSSLPSSALAKINPENVLLIYKAVPNMSASYNYTIWQAVMEIVVSAYRVADMGLTDVSESTDATVYFLNKNSLNSVLINLETSTKAIVDEIESSRQSSVYIFLILLAVASTALLISTILLIPVVNKVKMNKQEVFELFMLIKKRDVDIELNKCRKYFGGIQANPETEFIGQPEDDNEEQQDQENGEEGKQGEKNNDPLFKKGWDKARGGQGRITRKYKKLSSNIGKLMFKFIFLIALMEGYFIMMYFFSSTFLDRVSKLTQELKLLITRLPKHSFLLLIQKLVIFKNYNVQIMNQDSITFVANYHNQLYDEEQSLVDTYTSNYDDHSETYNKAFNSIVYSNVCQYLDDFKAQAQTCQDFNQGILTKGIYSSVMKYWDYLRQINTDFMASKRAVSDQYKYLNDDKLIMAEQMQAYYFTVSFNYLIDLLEKDLDLYFDKEIYKDRILFVVYILYLIFVYLFIWRLFVVEMQEEQWKTKTILSILPPELIMTIPEIKGFILNHSSTVFFAKTNQSS